MYNAKSDQWKSGPSSTYRRRQHSCATVFGNKVIVAGGINDTYYMKSVEILDIASSKWNNGPDLPEAIESSALVASDPRDSAYLIAGSTSEGESSKVFRLRNTLDEWTHIGNIKKKRDSHVALSVPLDFFPGCFKGMYKIS